MRVTHNQCYDAAPNRDLIIRCKMNLIQLEYYVATIEYGSYAQAGKAHFVSPQAVSKAVADLEKELGIELLSRKSNSISVTELGALFAIKAQEVLNSAKDLTDMARNAIAESRRKSRITIAVGTQPFRGCAVTAGWQRNLNEEAQAWRFSMLFNTDDSCLAALNYGFAQAAIVLGRSHYDNQTSIKLADMPIRIAMWDDHPLASRTDLRIADLEGAPIARPYNLTVLLDVIQRHFDLFQLKPLYQDVAPTFDSHASFMKESHGIVLVYGEAMGLVDEHIVYKEMARSDVIAIPICLVHQNDCALSSELLVNFYSSVFTSDDSSLSPIARTA